MIRNKWISIPSMIIYLCLQLLLKSSYPTKCIKTWPTATWLVHWAVNITIFSSECEQKNKTEILIISRWAWTKMSFELRGWSWHFGSSAKWWLRRGCNYRKKQATNRNTETNRNRWLYGLKNSMSWFLSFTNPARPSYTLCEFLLLTI